VLDPYDELGVDPTASGEELKRAYRRRARQLHPDHGRNDAEAMIRLNQAWAMLGQPAAGGPGPDDREDGEGFRSTRPWRTPLLPWIILAVVMLAIFVFTAYAGPHSGVR